MFLKPQGLLKNLLGSAGMLCKKGLPEKITLKSKEGQHGSR
jgi:hypothetical protein